MHFFSVMPEAPVKSRSFKGEAKSGYKVGLEFDHLSIRGARLAFDGQGGHTIENLVDVTGDFSQDADLIEGLKQVKDRLKIQGKDKIATCISGKQVSVSQLAFRRLPAEEMESALRLEMRKFIPFEISGATLEYQVMTETASQSETVQVLVVIAGSGLVSRHLEVLGKAGLAPTNVDVLPLAVANALWAWVGTPKSDSPHVAVHVGPQLSTIVIDGAASAFFNRYVYFGAEDLVGRDPKSGDVDKRVHSLAEEIARSLAFYEKSTFSRGFQELVLLGEFLDSPTLLERIGRQTGLAVRKMDVPKKMGYAHEMPPGRFDLATALAIRAGHD